MSKNVLNKNRFKQELSRLPDDLPSEFLTASPPLVPEKILVTKRQGQFNHKLISFHDRFVLFIPIEGDSNVLLDRTLLSVPPNHGLLIFPHQFHNLARTTSEDILWLIITFAIPEYKELEKLRDTPVEFNDESLGWIESIVTCYNHTKDNNNLAARATCLLTMFLSEMLFLSNSHVKTIREDSWNTAGQKLISEAANFIAENILKPLTIDELSDHLNVSPSLIQKHFKNTLATSAGSYIRAARILHSANLLRNSNKTIGEIADHYNFNNPYSYSKTFKQVMGMSPKSYRRSTDLPNT